jgi:hypothetical protein
METITIHADHHKIKALVQFLKAFNIPYELSQDKPYNKEFTERVLLAEKQIKEGKGIKLDPDNLWK